MTEGDGWKNQSRRAEKTQIVTARLPVRLVDKVDAIAGEHDTNRTAIIKDQLEKFVDDQARAAVEQTFTPANPLD